MAASPTLQEVNALVTATTALIGAQEIPGTTTRKGITDVPPAEQRFIPVLEALASLAVFKQEGQIVAASVFASGTFLRFTMAENEAVPTRVMDHIRELVGTLQQYSRASAAEKPAIKLAILKNTYMHSYPKLNKRFKGRPVETLEIAFADMHKDLGASALVNGALEVISVLASAHAVMLGMAKWFPTIKLPQKPKGNQNLLPPDATWMNLIEQVEQVNLDLEVVLDNALACQEWADKLQGVGGLPPILPLFRWIQKLSSHHRQIDHLLRWADSPAGKQDLSLVDGPKCLLSVDDNKPTGVPGGVVHCECALISNLAPQMLQMPRPVNYIGVSKLSCAACAAWIEAYNESAHVKFYTRGTHGRWYPTWTMSTVYQPQPLLNRMFDIVTLAKKTFEDAVTKYRRIELTDSTGAEGILVPGPPPRTKVYLSAAARAARRPKP